MNSCLLTLLLQVPFIDRVSDYFLGLVKLWSYITRMWFILSRRMNMEFFTLQLGSDVGASQILFFQLARVGIETGALYQILFLASYVLPCYHFLITISSNRSTVNFSHINCDWRLRPKKRCAKPYTMILRNNKLFLACDIWTKHNVSSWLSSILQCQDLINIVENMYWTWLSNLNMVLSLYV